MHFGQGIPAAEDKRQCNCCCSQTSLLTRTVCPEHEHWQQRTLLNPISISHHFTEANVGGLTPTADADDELIVERPVFSAKDPNIAIESIRIDSTAIKAH